MKPELNKIYLGDALAVLKKWPDSFINCCVTSPPYWGLRDYGVKGQLGLEKTPEEFVTKMVEIFREVRRILRDDGTLWLNLGDSYSNIGKSGGSSSGKHCKVLHQGHQSSSQASGGKIVGLKPKDLVGIPWMVAFALRADGWYLRSEIIWHKPNPMPESVTDRPTKSHEQIFLLSKSESYFCDMEAIKEKANYADYAAGNMSKNDVSKSRKRDGTNGEASFRAIVATRNKRTVWTVPSSPFAGAHFATFPPDLIQPCIEAGAPKRGIVFDPFMGAGTTALVSAKYGRNFLGTELNSDYLKIAEARVANELAQGKLF